MEFLDLNLSEVTTNTLDNLDDISFSPKSNDNKQAGGGFFDLFTSKSTHSKVDKALVEAAKAGKFDTVEFILDNDLGKTYNYQEPSGEKNTVLHYLTAANQQDLVKKAIDRGADMSIRNASGLRIDTETEFGSEETIPEQKVSAKPLTAAFEQPIASFFGLFKKKAKGKDCPPLTSEALSANITETQLQPEEGSKEKDLLEDLRQQLENIDKPQAEKRVSSVPTEQQQTGGAGCGCGGDGDNETEQLICGIKNYLNQQTGGVRSRRSRSIKREGKRKLNLSDIDMDLEKESESAARLERMIVNQTTEIINRVVTAIVKIIEEGADDFKGLEATEETARAFKSLLWRMIKENNPDISGSLDIAVEMEKTLTPDLLKSIKVKDVKAMIKTLAEYYAEKEKRKAEKGEKGEKQASSEEKPKKKRGRKSKGESESISATSSESVPGNIDLSPTSA